MAMRRRLITVCPMVIMNSYLVHNPVDFSSLLSHDILM